MPEDLPEHMPEDMPDRMPEDMPEHMPEDMPDRMPECMPDRMPEDLPVTKCINVMVGITRSKVIFYCGGRGLGFQPFVPTPSKSLPFRAGYAAVDGFPVEVDTTENHALETLKPIVP